MTCSRYTFLASVLALTSFTGCDLGDGGANDGQRQPGGGDDGVSLRSGEIAVSPHGTTFMARVGSSLIHADIDGSWRKLGQLEDPERLAFSPTREVIYVITDGPNRLRAHDLLTDRQLWSAHVPGGEDYLWDWDSADVRPWLHVTDDDRFLAVVTYDEVALYDAQTGESAGRWSSDRQIVDFDLDPSGDAAYVTLSEEWTDDGGPSTPFVTLELPSLAQSQIALPNCADETVMDTEGRYAFMAPTRCNQDPVSVIDLQSGAFVRNLPGFGPVSLAAGGDVAVAFMDLDNLDESLFLPGDPKPEGDRQYHLMLIDTETLEFQTVELGDSLPRYAPTPDGKLLLVDANAWYDDERVRVFDLATGELSPVLGPDIRLENFVMTRDSKYAYLVDDGAYELSIGERILSSLPLSIIPTNINLTADDRWILLQDDLGPVHIYDRNASKVTAVAGAERSN